MDSEKFKLEELKQILKISGNLAGTLQTSLDTLDKFAKRRQRVVRIENALWLTFIVIALCLGSLSIYNYYSFHQEMKQKNRIELYTALLNDYNDYAACMQKSAKLNNQLNTISQQESVYLSDQCSAYSLAFSLHSDMANHYFHIDSEIQKQIMTIKSMVKQSKHNKKQVNISTLAKQILASLESQTYFLK